MKRFIWTLTTRSKGIFVRTRHEDGHARFLQRIPQAERHSEVQSSLHNARFAAHGAAIHAAVPCIHHNGIGTRGRFRTHCLRAVWLRRMLFCAVIHQPRSEYPNDAHQYPQQQCVTRVPEPRARLPLPHKITSW